MDIPQGAVVLLYGLPEKGPLIRLMAEAGWQTRRPDAISAGVATPARQPLLLVGFPSSVEDAKRQLSNLSSNLATLFVYHVGKVNEEGKKLLAFYEKELRLMVKPLDANLSPHQQVDYIHKHFFRQPARTVAA